MDDGNVKALFMEIGVHMYTTSFYTFKWYCPTLLSTSLPEILVEPILCRSEYHICRGCPITTTQSFAVSSLKKSKSQYFAVYFFVQSMRETIVVATIYMRPKMEANLRICVAHHGNRSATHFFLFTRFSVIAYLLLLRPTKTVFLFFFPMWLETRVIYHLSVTSSLSGDLLVMMIFPHSNCEHHPPAFAVVCITVHCLTGATSRPRYEEYG